MINLRHSRPHVGAFTLTTVSTRICVTDGTMGRLRMRYYLTQHAVAPHELGHPRIPVLDGLLGEEGGQLLERVTVVRAQSTAAAAFELGQDDLS